MKIDPESARQGVTTRKHLVAKILVISTCVAFLALFAIAYIS